MCHRPSGKGTALVIISLLSTVILSAIPAVGQGATTQRPIQDFLDAQGSFCLDDGHGGCFLFIPPDPNFLGWSTDLIPPPSSVRFAAVDYAGVASEAYATGRSPQISGSVSERPLPDGHAEVTVLLHTRNANIWVIDIDLSGDVLAQIAGKPTLFGHRPADVAAGQGQALADSLLHAVFINSAPSAPLPDLLEINGTPDLKFLAFSAQARGPLTAEFGVAEGTPGKCTITQTGLFMTQATASTHAFDPANGDFFPVEAITLTVVGR